MHTLGKGDVEDTVREGVISLLLAYHPSLSYQSSSLHLLLNLLVNHAVTCDRKTVKGDVLIDP